MRGIKEDHLGTKVGVDAKSALHWAVAQTTVQEDGVTAQNANVTPQRVDHSCRWCCLAAKQRGTQTCKHQGMSCA